MKCWYCGKETMFRALELGSGWFECCQCGATHSENPPLSNEIESVVVERNPVDGKTKYRPSFWVTERARKAREG